jgi:CheY-like chemotaxis protein
MWRILVVDDDLHTRLAMGIWLKQCGFRVAITDGAESGLAALSDGTFDLMIADVFMPNMQRSPPLRARRRTFQERGRIRAETARERPCGVRCFRRRGGGSHRHLSSKRKKPDNPTTIAAEE